MLKRLIPLFLLLSALAPASASAQSCDGALEWTGIIPDCLLGSATYHVMFITRNERTAGSTDINNYNTFVQEQAAGAALFRDTLIGDTRVADTFRAIGSTQTVNARDNTGIRGRVFYFNGRKVADSFNDFWDGSWDSREGRFENGMLTGNVQVWTGGDRHGRTRGGFALGERFSIEADSASSAYLGGNRAGPNFNRRHFYAVSGLLTVPPGVSLGEPSSATLSEEGPTDRSATLTVNLPAPATTALTVLIDITQTTPSETPPGVTYGLDYSVAIVGNAANFGFDSANPDVLRTRRVVVPFARGQRSRTLELTALSDVDGLSEVLSIKLADGDNYRIDTTAVARTLTLVDPPPKVSLSEPSPATLSEERDDRLATLMVNLVANAPTDLTVLIDITQTTPPSTPPGVTYGLDYGVAIVGDAANFSFDSANPDVLRTRRVVVPFVAGQLSRTLELTALSDADTLNEELSIALADGDNYVIDAAAAARTLRLTDITPRVSLSEPSPATLFAEGPGDRLATLMVNLAADAPTDLAVLIDITQTTPSETPPGVTYGLDYGVAIDGDATGFSFDSADPDVLQTRRVVVPFAIGQRSRTLELTALSDADTLNEELSIALADGDNYIIDATAVARTLTLIDAATPRVSLSEPSPATLSEGASGESAMLTVSMVAAAASALTVLIDITQTTPSSTPPRVTYGLDYGVAIDGDAAGFSFDRTGPAALRTRRVVVPFAAGQSSRTLELTALEDVDGQSEVLSIRLVDDDGYFVDPAARLHSLTLTDNEPVVSLAFVAKSGTRIENGRVTERGPGASQRTISSNGAEFDVEVRSTIPIPTSFAQVNLVVDSDVEDSIGRRDVIVSPRSGTIAGSNSDLLDLRFINILRDNTVARFQYQIAAENDNRVEGAEILQMRVVPGNNYQVSPDPSESTQRLEILDDIRLTINTAARTAVEGGASARVVLDFGRAPGPGETVTATVTITPAPDAQDYSVLVDGTVVPAPGNGMYEVTLPQGEQRISLTVRAEEDADTTDEIIRLMLRRGSVVVSGPEGVTGPIYRYEPTLPSGSIAITLRDEATVNASRIVDIISVQPDPEEETSLDFNLKDGFQPQPSPVRLEPLTEANLNTASLILRLTSGLFHNVRALDPSNYRLGGTPPPGLRIRNVFLVNNLGAELPSRGFSRYVRVVLAYDDNNNDFDQEASINVTIIDRSNEDGGDAFNDDLPALTTQTVPITPRTFADDVSGRPDADILSVQPDPQKETSLDFNLNDGFQPQPSPVRLEPLTEANLSTASLILRTSFRTLFNTRATDPSNYRLGGTLPPGLRIRSVVLVNSLGEELINSSFSSFVRMFLEYDDDNFDFDQAASINVTILDRSRDALNGRRPALTTATVPITPRAVDPAPRVDISVQPDPLTEANLDGASLVLRRVHFRNTFADERALDINNYRLGGTPPPGLRISRVVHVDDDGNMVESTGSTFTNRVRVFLEYNDDSFDFDQAARISITVLSNAYVITTQPSVTTVTVPITPRAVDPAVPQVDIFSVQPDPEEETSLDFDLDDGFQPQPSPVRLEPLTEANLNTASLILRLTSEDLFHNVRALDLSNYRLGGTPPPGLSFRNVFLVNNLGAELPSRSLSRYVRVFLEYNDNKNDFDQEARISVTIIDRSDGDGGDALSGTRPALTTQTVPITPRAVDPATTVTEVALTSDAGEDRTYRSGEDIDVTVTFGSTVEVIPSDAAGLPTVALTIGTETRQATYNDISADHRQLIFRYRVRDGDFDENGVSIGTGALQQSLRGIGNPEINGNNGRAVSASFPAVDPAVDTRVAVSDDPNHAVDAVAPTVTGVAITSTGPYARDDVIELTATFNQVVTVFDQSGEVVAVPDQSDNVPQIVIVLGDTFKSSRRADYTSGSGSTTLVFSYTVAPVSSDNDNDGVSVEPNALRLNDGAIQSAFGNPATLLHAAIPADPAHRVDAIVPRLRTATVDGDTLALTYTEALNKDSVPASTDWRLILLGTSRTPSPTVNTDSVTVNEATVTMKLSEPVRPGEGLSLFYTSGTNPLLDLAGNQVPNLVGREVEDNTTLVLAITSPEVLEGNVGSTTTMTYVVTLAGSPPQPQDVIVEYFIQGDSTATRDTDYTVSGDGTGTLTFTPTVTTQNIVVTVLGDTLHEPTETIIVGAFISSLRALDGEFVTATGGIGGIRNDDPAPVVSLVLAPASIPSRGGVATVTASTVTAKLDGFSSVPTTVTVSATPVSPAVASDYTLSDPSVLTIAAGELNSTGDVTITAVDTGATVSREVTVSATVANISGDLADPPVATLTITPPIPGTNICGRTPAVRAAIVIAAGATDCTDVDLASVTGLDLINGLGTTALQNGDFAGLTGLETLQLGSNSDAFAGPLPASLFSDLQSLTTLGLRFNGLTELPADAFTGLSALEELFLNNNALTSIEVGAFNGLDALRVLRLQSNAFTPDTGLPIGVFDDVLNALNAPGASFNVDNNVRQAHFVCSRSDFEAIVDATVGVTECHLISSAQFNTALPLIDATLSQLTISAGTLDPVFAPGTTTYTATVPNSVVSVTVTPTAAQTRATITVNANSVDSGSASARITLTPGTPEAIAIEVTADDTITTQTYTVTVTRASAPSITAIALTSNAGDGVYAIGDAIEATVTFSQPVTVTNLPQLALTVGTQTRQAVYASDSSTATALAFRYTVAAADEDDDGVSIDADALTHTTGTNASTIRAVADTTTDALITHSAVAADTQHRVDGVAPTIINNGDVAISTGPYIEGEAIELTATFSEAVTVDTTVGTPQIELTVDATPRQAVYASGSTTTALVFSYTVVAGENDADGVEVAQNALEPNNGTIRDAAGNNAVLDHNRIAATPANRVDTAAPTISTATIDGRTLTLTYDEELDAISVPAPSDYTLALTSGTAPTVNTGGVTISGTRVTLALSAAVVSTDDVTLTYTADANPLLDLAGNRAADLTAQAVDNTTDALPSFGTAAVAAQIYTVGVAVDPVLQLPAASGGNEPLSYTLAPALPNGLTFNAENRQISGTPTASAPPTTYTLTATDADASDPDSATLEFMLTVIDAVVSATLTATAPLTEAALFASTSPTVTVTLVNTEYEATLTPASFTVSDTVAGGDITLDDVNRGADGTTATLTLGFDGADLTGDGDLSVTVTAAGHTGTGDLSAGSVSITASTGVNVCGRTAQVRDAIVGQDAIVRESSATECTSITELASITVLDLGGQSIVSLQPGDFAGLTALQALDLFNNHLEALPATIFAGLTSLQGLGLGNNALAALPATIFAGLTSLEILGLGNNALKLLPATIFNGLEKLSTLGIFGNDFTANTGLPAGTFDDVLDTLGPITTPGPPPL